MKYILNETPVKTTNNFMINNISLDLDIEEKDFSKININYDKGINIKETIESNFNSKINIKHDKYKLINIDVFDNSNIKINTNLETNYLVYELNFILKDNTTSNILIRYGGEGYHNLKISIKALKNSKSNITIINSLLEDSKSFISFENDIEEDSNININFIDIGGKIKISNYYSLLKKNSYNSLNNIYIGKDEDIIDMNYNIINKGININSLIEVSGALFNKSNKSFKGTIDFVKGSTKSIGYENENCLLFSNEAKSKSLPMLLCHEEDVNGTHSVSVGKVMEDKLFYLQSRGISEEDSKKLIMLGNFNKVLSKVENKEEIVDEILNYIK